MSQKILVIGGSGRVAMLATERLIRNGHKIDSCVRSKAQFDKIAQLGATPKLLSVEDASVEDFRKALEGIDTVLWSAGAGGKGGPERSNAVDYLGSKKVLDAIESLPVENRPVFVTVSALDTRDMDKEAPKHYTTEDIEKSHKGHKAIGAYYDAKLLADRDLIFRNNIKWKILRPGQLLDDDESGKVEIGLTPLTPGVSRSDVAAVLVELIERKDGDKLALDLIGGNTPIKEALDDAIAKNKTSQY